MSGTITVSFWFFALVAAGVLNGQNMCVLLLGALFHEAGHLTAMTCCGGKIRSMEIGFFGAKIIPCYQGIPSVAREGWILCAGPLAGATAGVVAATCGAMELAKVNWLLTAFNLLPLPGLDGGSLLALLLSARYGEPGEKIALVAGAGATILLFLVTVKFLSRMSLFNF